MTTEQINAMYEIQEHLKEAKKKLDFICFVSGGIDDIDFQKCRDMHSKVCEALDVY